MNNDDGALTESEKKRYARQILLSDWGEGGQQKLKKATVFIAGAGGLGSPVALYLAAAGIGCIKICDAGSVELSNLNRQIIYEEGEILVMDKFSEGDQINEYVLTYQPIKYCSVHSPIVIDNLKLMSWHDPTILEKVKNDETYIVPENEAVGFWYVAVKPIDMPVVCQMGETYVVKDQICVDTLAIVTPCVNGILDTDGTCILQPKINYVCEGQVEILSDGTQVCNIFIPIREKYICQRLDGTEFEVENPIDCYETLDIVYYCNGDIINHPSECAETITKKY